jgi:hypothetical protein
VAPDRANGRAILTNGGVFSMASFDSILRAESGVAGHWRIEVDGARRRLVHYSTTMLVWERDTNGKVRMVDSNIGIGSHTDQQGMNRAFRALGLPFRFYRDAAGGGARIAEAFDY